MPQQYTPQDNKLVPWPIVTEPDREINTPIGVFYNANFDKDLEAYNNWLSLPRPLILDEKDFKEGEVYELDKDFRIDYQAQTISDKWRSVTEKMYQSIIRAPNGRIVAIPINNDTGITEDSEIKTKNMKSGIELIAEERQEQIEKHGFDVNNDKYYSKNELKKRQCIV
jgi:hypothetical protein